MKEIVLTTDLRSFPTIVEADPDAFLQNDRNTTITVYLRDGGVLQNFSSADEFMFHVTLPDKTMRVFVDLPPHIAGYTTNKAFLRLPSSCYDQVGPIQIVIKVRNNSEGTVTTIGVVKGNVYPSRI